MRFTVLKMLQLTSLVLWLSTFSTTPIAQTRTVDPTLTAHEWGTFTSVAGSDGQAVEWRPLDLRTDLPGFVEHLNFVAFKQGLRSTVRMETPVLYFYSPQELTLSVQVAFPSGLITEWYPHASTPAHNRGADDAALFAKHVANGQVAWNSVHVQPGWRGEFPREATPRSKFGIDVDLKGAEAASHYYAARETSSAPLEVSTPDGEQHEKFLFYRGVSFVSVPLSAKFGNDGSLHVKSALPDEIPSLILFERRGDRIGYRITKPLPGGSEEVLQPPNLTARIESLYGDLEGMLVAFGLYRDEAHAMIETWRNSWFEEGSRLFYIVPRPFVDSILPLTITPAPAQTVRLFVGRVELISPATQKAVAEALASKDHAALDKYGRFLEPIMAVLAKNKMLPKGGWNDCPCPQPGH